MALFKTAPKYLSGVSVFYGDDITRRETDGELVVFMAPASKGPLVPVDIKNIDNIVGIYGRDSALSKIAHQFWDGYQDSSRTYPVRPIAMRIGGIQSRIELSNGTIIESADARNGLEGDYLVYVNNTEDALLKNIKIWTKAERLKVYDYQGKIDAGYFVVTPVFTADVFEFGKDIDYDPRETGSTIGDLAADAATVNYRQSDAQTSMTNRDLYTAFRNALLQVETFTPDYIVPGGVTFDAVDTFTGLAPIAERTTKIVASASQGDSFIKVDAAESWPDTGDITIVFTNVTTNLTNTETTSYTKKEYNGLSYILTLENPLIGPVLISTDGTKINTVTNTNFTKTYQRELGIGFVKETYVDGMFDHKWADSEFVSNGNGGYERYNLAHFGYMFANFCNEAAVGYNTPLVAMNTSTPLNTADRVSVDAWAGKKATRVLYGTDETRVVGVTGVGSGLLGNSIMAGTGTYNRSAWSSPSDSKFVDPAFGLLATDTGFVDGGAIYDTYGNLVDLGKFIMVGAGLLTFYNAGATVPYTDTCGIYALGLMTGTPKNEGISFKRIGVSSRVSVGTIVNRSIYNELVGVGYVCVTREKRLGWVINNDHSVARNDSAYNLISTTRLVKDIIERKRDIMVNYIGKTANRLVLEAARTKIAESFSQDVQYGYLNGYNFSLDPDNTSTTIGKLFLKASINPPLEICQVDIDTVIDRNLTAQ